MQNQTVIESYTVLFLYSLTLCGQVLKVWYIL